MPAGALHSAAVAGAVEVLPPHGLPIPDLAHSDFACWHPSSSSRAGRGRWSSQFLATAPQGDDLGGGRGAGGHGGPPSDGDFKDAGDSGEASGKPPGKTVNFVTQMGKTVPLDGSSLDKCINSCKTAPELKDNNQSGMSGLLNASTGGERTNIMQCSQFCQREFELFCFPGDSTVVVRNKGRVPLAQLRVGDMVLAVSLPAVGDNKNCGCVLHFDTVLAFLHHDPNVEGEVLQIRHALGKVQLTPKHILFAQRRCSDGSTAKSAVPVLAEEVCIGDRLLTPWIDGSLTTPEILAVERVWKQGLYAPLLGGGTLLVDGTAVSCYAIPRNLATSPAFRRIADLIDGTGCVHTAAHALFLPLRLCHAAAMRLPGLHDKTDSGNSNCAGEAKVCSTDSGGIHPYAWVIYVVAASLLA